MKYIRAFTLIEVLLALSIIAIAFAALLKASSSDIINTERLRNKTLSHWVAMQALSMIQLGTINISNQELISEQSTILDKTFYWQAYVAKTDLKHVQRVEIKISLTQNGPFHSELIGYRYQS